MDSKVFGCFYQGIAFFVDTLVLIHVTFEEVFCFLSIFPRYSMSQFSNAFFFSILRSKANPLATIYKWTSKFSVDRDFNRGLKTKIKLYKGRDIKKKVPLKSPYGKKRLTKCELMGATPIKEL
ncbi:hypothetical protein DNTS_001107 [Danionella cerebrum]|uniref:Uncharacterized protein n=1 Tax=Danionella cerebrum TaxID=2873325 RepID=A0A553Q989_9TELE|nr:hypothetical protein DNTS_001107 [Danionella translucida]